MTTKEHFIARLRKARTEHLKWLNQIKLLVSGITVDKSGITVNQSESAFGSWLYGEAIAFTNSNSKQVLQDIDHALGECFEHYFKIYHTLVSKHEGGFMSGLLGPKKPTSNELMLSQKFYEELVVASDGLMGRLRLFESQLLATGDAKFDELICADEPVEEKSATPPRAKVQRMYRGQPVDM